VGGKGNIRAIEKSEGKNSKNGQNVVFWPIFAPKSRKTQKSPFFVEF
jgi:hypothetical protein